MRKMIELTIDEQHKKWRRFDPVTLNELRIFQISNDYVSLLFIVASLISCLPLDLFTYSLSCSLDEVFWSVGEGTARRNFN